MVNETATVDQKTLESFGEAASRRYVSEGGTLNDSVISVIGSEKLSSEHVKRVVEFANNKTFGRVFKLASPDNRLVNFAGGPASPDTVLGIFKGSKAQEATMMKAASGREYMRGAESLELMLLDEGVEKVASTAINVDAELRDFLHLEKEAQNVEYNLRVLGARFEKSTDSLCKEAEHLIRSGVGSADIAQVISDISPAVEVTKLALKQLSSRLIDVDAPVTVVKTAASQEVNVNHPLCKSFEKFASAAVEYYDAAAAADHLRDILKEARATLKEVTCSVH